MIAQQRAIALALLQWKDPVEYQEILKIKVRVKITESDIHASVRLRQNHSSTCTIGRQRPTIDIAIKLAISIIVSLCLSNQT